MGKSKFNAVFIGGSITEGGAASSYAKCWVNLVGEYLKETFPDKEVNIINAGIGGTGSYLGVFRLKKDVIAHDPDMVFIEFAVNDMGYKSSPWLSSICMEGIVRQLAALDKIPAVVFVFTPSYHSNAFSSVHRKIAYYYNIPCIDLQDKIWKQIGSGLYSWRDIEVDEVHPNDRGHKLFADLITGFMEANRDVFTSKPVVKNETITGYEFKNPRLDSFRSARYYGNWSERPARKKRIGTVIYSGTPGDYLEYDFFGRCIGLYHIVSPNSGIINVTIDGKQHEPVDFFKNFETDYCLMHCFNLDNDWHRLRIEISGKRNPGSNGDEAAIGYFMID